MNTILFAIILVPIIEIYLLIKIGSQIGAITIVFQKLSKKNYNKESEKKNYIDGDFEDIEDDHDKKI